MLQIIKTEQNIKIKNPHNLHVHILEWWFIPGYSQLQCGSNAVWSTHQTAWGSNNKHVNIHISKTNVKCYEIPPYFVLLPREWVVVYPTSIDKGTFHTLWTFQQQQRDHSSVFHLSSLQRLLPHLNTLRSSLLSHKFDATSWKDLTWRV